MQNLSVAHPAMFSRLLSIANCSVNWFACAKRKRSTCTSCRMPSSSESHANPIMWIGLGFGPQNLLFLDGSKKLTSDRLSTAIVPPTVQI